MTLLESVQSEMQRPGSVPSPRPPLSVAGSPFNGIKIGLAIRLSGGFSLWRVAEAFLMRTATAQLAATGAYGVAGMTRANIRIRRRVRSVRRGAK